MEGDNAEGKGIGTRTPAGCGTCRKRFSAPTNCGFSLEIPAFFMCRICNPVRRTGNDLEKPAAFGTSETFFGGQPDANTIRKAPPNHETRNHNYRNGPTDRRNPRQNERAEVLKFFERPLPRDTLLTTRKAADFAGVHRKTLFGWERKGYLHPKRITPSRVRWSKRELESFLCETAG